MAKLKLNQLGYAASGEAVARDDIIHIRRAGGGYKGKVAGDAFLPAFGAADAGKQLAVSELGAAGWDDAHEGEGWSRLIHLSYASSGGVLGGPSQLYAHTGSGPVTDYNDMQVNFTFEDGSYQTIRIMPLVGVPTSTETGWRFWFDTPRRFWWAMPAGHQRIYHIRIYGRK